MSNKLPIAVVVIPTYNEAETIGEMIDVLCTKLFPTIKNWDCKLLIADDTSPDGTYRIVQQKQKKYKNLELSLLQGKSGIGAAYVKGFKYAMAELKADVVIEFDGDFQHPIDSIPIMLKEIEDGADYVLGSRKIKGGSNPKGWGFKRLFFSEVGGFVARTIMFFPFKSFFQVTDPTTGLKASRVKGFVDTMDMDHLYSKSFAYKIEFLYKMIALKAKVKEISLKFQVRDRGVSKIDTKTAKEILVTSIKLRFFDPFTQKFLKFGLVGGFGFVINLIGFRSFKVIFKGLPLDVSWINTFSNSLASELAIISNFTFNNIWTFKKDKISGLGQLVSKFVTFNLSSFITGIVVPSAFIGLCTNFFGDQYSTVYLIIGVFGLTIPLNWFVYNHFIWKK